MNVEKKIIVGLVVAGTVVALGFAIVMAQKSIISREEVRQNEVIAGEAPTTTTEVVEHKSKIATKTQQGTDSRSEEIALARPSAPPSKKSGATEINWELLYKLDYKTGKAPAEVKRLHKSKVRIPGFVVPLSDDLTKLTEFLLVPNAQACIHVPPPPPNLIVYVQLKNPLSVDQITNPSWVEGDFLIQTTESEYGAAAYVMKADKMEEYKF